MPRKTAPLIEVRWWDIVGSAEWLSTEEATGQTPQECISVGYLIRETKKFIVIAGTYSPEGVDQWTAVFSIPKACIFSRKKLR